MRPSWNSSRSIEPTANIDVSNCFAHCIMRNVIVEYVCAPYLTQFPEDDYDATNLREAHLWTVNPEG